MAPRFRFSLKTADQTSWTILADEPEGWSEMSQEIVRDYEIHGLLVNTKAVLKFSGDGYDFIYDIDQCRSFCSEVQIKVEELCSEEGNYEDFFEGLIKMGDVKFYMNLCTCESPIIDNSYYARIKNNASIEAYPHVAKSKNGVDISAATISICRMFRPSTGVVGGDRKAYRVFEILKFLVAFMSDGEVGFRSDYFDTGEMKGLFLTNGIHLKDNDITHYQNADIGKISFQSLNDELYKIANLGFMMEPGPVLRLEPADYFYGDTVIDTLDFASGVVKKTKTEQLYTYVNFGSDKIITQEDYPALSFPDEINFLGFKDEKLHLSGQCNTDVTLDLKGSFVRSSNVIEDLLDGVTAATVNEYDEDFIFVSAEDVGGGVYEAIQYDTFNIGVLPYFYNGNLTNDKVAVRFFGAIPNTISLLSSTENHSFRAENFDCYHTGTPEVFTDLDYGPLHFPNVTTAPNFNDGDYNAALYEYVVPADGAYSFSSSIRLKMHLHGSVKLTGLFQVFDAADVFLREFTFDSTTTPNTGGDDFFKLNGFKTIQCFATEKVKVYIRFEKIYSWVSYFFYVGGACGTLWPNNPDIFACSSGGNIYKQYNPEDFKSVQYKFEYPVSGSRWKNIRENSRQILGFNINGVTPFLPWIETMSRKSDGMATITLIGKQALKNCD